MENPWRQHSTINPQRKPRREISNDVFHALIAAKLSGAVYQIVLTVIDRTWGFNLQEKLIPSSHFEKVTGLSRQSVWKAIKVAEALRLIVVERDSTRVSLYMFNKHYDTWLVSRPPKIIKYIKTHIPSRLRWEVWERDDFTCQKCHSRKNLTIDHIIPESLGGETVKENLQTLCNSCNSRKGHHA